MKAVAANCGSDEQSGGRDYAAAGAHMQHDESEVVAEACVVVDLGGQAAFHVFCSA